MLSEEEREKKRRTGLPRFKGKGRYDSFIYPQSGFKFDSDSNILTLSKLGKIKVTLHRHVDGIIKRVNINRRPTGRRFVCFFVDHEPKKQPFKFKDGAVVGVDVGLLSFAMLSNGEKIENQRFFRREAKELAKTQRKFSAQEKKKGTPERACARKVVARMHERIANWRSDFAHQLSSHIVDRFGVIAFEDLNIKGMMHNGHLAKSIGDIAWRQFTTYTKNKAEEAGSIVVMVNPNNTSQQCSRCGVIIKKELKDCTHSCSCGLIMDRDENAAINILRRGLASIGERTLEAPCES